MDVNVPKFLSHDLPLFAGIISDLFPGVNKPEVDYTEIKDACAESCKGRGLQLVEVFFEKIIQLYEMTIVRHGLMLVGPTMGGKSCCYTTLKEAMTLLAKGGSDKYFKVQTVRNGVESRLPSVDASACCFLRRWMPSGGPPSRQAQRGATSTG